MRLGPLLIVCYWTLFTIRAGLNPKVAAEVKAATYDMNRTTGVERLKYVRRLQCWTMAKWTLRICGWVENVALGALIMWTIYLTGAIIAGSVVLFGYPVY